MSFLKHMFREMPVLSTANALVLLFAVVGGFIYAITGQPDVMRFGTYSLLSMTALNFMATFAILMRM